MPFSQTSSLSSAVIVVVATIVIVANTSVPVALHVPTLRKDSPSSPKARPYLNQVSRTDRPLKPSFLLESSPRATLLNLLDANPNLACCQEAWDSMRVQHDALLLKLELLTQRLQKLEGVAQETADLKRRLVHVEQLVSVSKPVAVDEQPPEARRPIRRSHLAAILLAMIVLMFVMVWFAIVFKRIDRRYGLSTLSPARTQPVTVSSASSRSSSSS